MPYIANHYPLKPLYRSLYKGPASKALRLQGWDVRSEGLHTAIYHPGDKEPLLQGRVSRDLILESITVSEITACYHSHVAHLLRNAGLIRVARRDHELLYPEWYESFGVESLTDPDRFIPEVRGYYRWTWDIEQHSGRFWLVPRLGLRYISARPISDPLLSRWVKHHWIGDQPMGINLRTGSLMPLVWQEDTWVGSDWGKLTLLDQECWPVTFNMENLRHIHQSQDAFYATHEIVHAHPRDLVRSPFAPALANTRPLVVPVAETSCIEGQHLLFAKGVGGQMKSILGKGLLVKPRKPVRLLVCAAEDLWQKEQMRKYLRYVLGRYKTHPLREALHLPDAETVKQVWDQKWGVESYDFHKVVITYTQGGQISQPEELKRAVQLASQEGRFLIGFILLADEMMPRDAFDTLHGYFRGRMPTLPVMAQTITGKGQTAIGCFSIWANLAAEIAVKAEAIPWDVWNLPGADDQTLFIGLDLGHEHKQGYSKLSITLVDYRGRLLNRRPDVIVFEQNNESLRDAEGLRQSLQQLVRRAGVKPNRVILHRDGRFLEGEEETFLRALEGIPHIALVGIKKDAQTQISKPVDGLTWTLNHDRALLITSTQNGVAAPLEVELRVPGDITLAQAVAHVFWLTRVYQTDLFQPPRLPVTTRRANNTAGTGKKVHLKSWAKGKPVAPKPPR